MKSTFVMSPEHQCITLHFERVYAREGTPFSDYTIPGLVLAIVVGGSALLAAATVFKRREWAVLISALAGLLLTGYLVVQTAMVDHLDWFYAACFVFGMAIFGLATYLWMAEYRRQHFLTRQGSPRRLA